MPDSLLPKRWHVYVVDLDPRVRSKPGKQRPCLAIQPSEFSVGGLSSTVVIPLTTKVKGQNAFPLRVAVPKASCGLKQDSEFMIDRILAWDNSLFREDLGEIPEAIQEQVREALRDFLDID